MHCSADYLSQQQASVHATIAICVSAHDFGIARLKKKEKQTKKQKTKNKKAYSMLVLQLSPTRVQIYNCQNLNSETVPY